MEAIGKVITMVIITDIMLDHTTTAGITTKVAGILTTIIIIMDTGDNPGLPVVVPMDVTLQAQPVRFRVARLNQPATYPLITLMEEIPASALRNHQ
jgi:hypothetical protein